MKTYTIYQTPNGVWHLVISGSDRVLQYSYFDDLMEYLANKESEERS